ncbi:MAG: cadherin-like domain-containing protein [Bifidobacteriaceae bacterium]|nr:cadherin-like domain-containing protein [Bifidobacteriaceae bacterium]MCI1978872.1 cadherin-like domain-containing protein [Bifidobacteriaceae bacterium]
MSSIRQEHPHLDNGSVWITSLHDGKAARFNPFIEEADASVAASGATFDVEQRGNATLLNDQEKAYSIDAATLSTDMQTVKTTQTEVLMGGSTAVLFDSTSGKVWITSPATISTVTQTSEPTTVVGRGSRVTVASNGDTYIYNAADGSVSRYDVGTHPNSDTGKPTDSSTITEGKTLHAQALTAVGETAVILADNTLHWAGHHVTLAGHTDFVLQKTPSDSHHHESVALASAQGLTLVNLTTEKITEFHRTGKGLPAAPVSLGNCLYGAWASTTESYAKICADQDSTPLENWKDEEGGTEENPFLSLPQITATSVLVFRVNHRQVILNDAANGNVWNPSSSSDVIKIEWNRLTPQEKKATGETQQSVHTQHDFAENCVGKDTTTTANADEFGSRSGERQILDVLRNDRQTSCGVLRIEKIEPIEARQGRVSRIYNGRYLQLDLTKEARGHLAFNYSISDGRGQTSSATVQVAIVSNSVNNAPQQSDPPLDTFVEQEATVTVNALAGFTDPEGDTLMLTAARIKNSNESTVTIRPDGQLIFDAGTVQEGRVVVETTVSDGAHSATGLLYFSIKPAKSLKPLLDPVMRKVEPGKRIRVTLKDSLHGNSASTPQLISVKQPDNATVVSETDTTSFTFSATTTGTYYVSYTVRQGDNEALGMARLDVAELDDSDLAPLAVSDMAILDSTNSVIVEPLTNDVDPLGGVLALTDVTVSDGSGIKTGLIHHQRLYITVGKTPATPLRVSYTVVNAHASSTGCITVRPASLSPPSMVPKPLPLTATVRQGGIVTIPVIDSMKSADEAGLRLGPTLTYDEAFKGLAFISGDTIRYQAPNKIGTYTATYSVSDSSGNSASSTITLKVHKKNAQTKRKPQPKDIEARVVAGRKAKIPIPLTGIDHDGDDVTLLGLGNIAPLQGRITEVGADYLIYEAYPDSSGTDTFHYAVEDWSGQRVTAQVRVGILKASVGNGVVARDDMIQMRPDREVDVPVILNDLSESDDSLVLQGNLETRGIGNVTLEGNLVKFTTPHQQGDYYVTYTVENEAGIADTATLTVRVSATAPLSAPTALDDKVPASQTIDRRTVTVDVADFISNPCGTIDDLDVGVHPSASEHARISRKKSTLISVDLTNETRAVPYTVTNTRLHLTSTAFIQVPAYGVFPPLLRPKAPDLKVNAGEELLIRLTDYVRVGAGKQPSVLSEESVSATHSDGFRLWNDAQTLRFRAPSDYSGPASITFSVSDSSHSSQSTTSTLTLPIAVIGSTEAPPTFSSTTLDIVAGEDPQNISVAALTHAPPGMNSLKSRYLYSLKGSSTDFHTVLSRRGNLSVSAASTLAPGTTETLSIEIRYDEAKTITGTLLLTASATDRPLPHVTDRTVDISAKETTSLNVLTNAYNPFPGTPLILTGVHSSSEQVSVRWTPHGQLSLKPLQKEGTFTETVLFTVEDATRMESRTITGKVTVAVKSEPSAPLISRTASAMDGKISVSWTPGSANGSPIIEYEVAWTSTDVRDSARRSCGSETRCTLSTLNNGTPYSLRVRARNDIGWSDYSDTVTATPDVVPSAPTISASATGVGIINVSWEAVHNEGSPVSGYTVTTLCPHGSTTKTVASKRGKNTVQLTNLPYGDCSVTAKARNKLGESSDSSPVTVRVRGIPQTPRVTVESSSDGHLRGQISVEARAQKLTKLKCFIAGTICAVDQHQFSATFKGSDWYTGQKHTLIITADFEGIQSVTSKTTITMEKLNLGRIKTGTFVRKSGAGTMVFALGSPEETLPSDAHPTARITLSGCPTISVDYRVDEILEYPLSQGCTATHVHVTLYLGETRISSETSFPVTDESDDAKTTTPITAFTNRVTASRHRSQSTDPSMFLPNFGGHLWALTHVVPSSTNKLEIQGMKRT